MRKTFLSFSPPLIGEEEIAEVVDTLRSDWITTGPKVRRFEQEFAAAVDATSALALSSCTAALHVALATLGVGPGDAVITSTMTFCSTVHVIEHVGARPILVDVEPGTLNLDPRQVREALERFNTGHPGSGPIKAIIPVHLYGHPCDMDALFQIALEYGCAIVEDAAHALPARYKGRMIGARMPSLPMDGEPLFNSMAECPVPVLTCFSFYATKNMTTAEGGMLTGPPDLIERARIWSMLGMTRDMWKHSSSEGSWHYDVICAGFKCNMTDIQAALGLHQLRKLPDFHRRRNNIAQRYNFAFNPMPELETPAQESWASPAWHLYVLRLDLEQIGVSRNQFIVELRDRNIGTSVHFTPIHLHRYYREKYGYSPQDFPVAYAEYQRMISLPCSPRMTEEDVEDVIQAVTAVLRKYRPPDPMRQLAYAFPGGGQA